MINFGTPQRHGLYTAMYLQGNFKTLRLKEKERKGKKKRDFNNPPGMLWLTLWETWKMELIFSFYHFDCFYKRLSLDFQSIFPWPSPGISGNFPICYLQEIYFFFLKFWHTLWFFINILNFVVSGKPKLKGYNGTDQNHEPFYVWLLSEYWIEYTTYGCKKFFVLPCSRTMWLVNAQRYHYNS